MLVMTDERSTIRILACYLLNLFGENELKDHDEAMRVLKEISKQGHVTIERKDNPFSCDFYYKEE